MTAATRMQERRSRRAVAAVTAVLLLIFGWLGASHEADVAHVRDQRGHIVHAQELGDHHEEGPLSHFHGREADSHGAGACALLAITHAPLLAAKSPLAAAVDPIAAVRELAPPHTASCHAAIAGYRLAPKTSPPALI